MSEEGPKHPPHATEYYVMRAEWGKDPETNFLVRSLLSRDTLTPQQIISIVARVKRDKEALKIDELKQLIVRTKGVGNAITALAHIAQPIAAERVNAIDGYTHDLARLTPQKNMSPWMQNDRARTLAALLLSNPNVSMGHIVHALKVHCNIASLQVSAFHKPLARWKSTSPDPTQNPRPAFAKALSNDCQIYSPELYAELIPLAERIASQISDFSAEIRVKQSHRMKDALRPGKVKRLRERLNSALNILRSGNFSLPPLSNESKKRLEYAPFAAFIQAVRSQDSFSMPHIRAYTSKQAYPVKGFVAPEIQVAALTVDFNLEGGSENSRKTARTIRRYFFDDLHELRMSHKFSSTTSISHAMLQRLPDQEPILRCEWRDTGASWKKQASERKKTMREKSARRHQIHLRAIEHMLKKSANVDGNQSS